MEVRNRKSASPGRTSAPHTERIGSDAAKQSAFNTHYAYQSLKALVADPKYAKLASALILLGETVLCLLVIRYVRFTNIDWIAYMEQVKQYLDGERNYSVIKGDTGPLVYPAGFLYVYSLLHYFTDQGKDIRKAQYIFAGIYVATQAVVFRLYRFDGRIPPYAFALLALSKRLHSIYVLRLFNDGVAMLFLYCSIWALCKRRFGIACTLYSLALSIKMSILLFLPAFGAILLASVGLVQTVLLGLSMLAIQILLGLPFLLEDAPAYLSRAFEFSRAFQYKWTVNWRFLPEEVFLDRKWAAALLVGHLSVLLLAIHRWTSLYGGLVTFVRKSLTAPDDRVAAMRPYSLNPKSMLTLLFLSNLIGMTFARSLHYQFYAWEAHQLVFLAWQTKFPLPVKFLIHAGIELGWETYPSTILSSTIMLASHVLLCVGVIADLP